jgi:hypothetical protein
MPGAKDIPLGICRQGLLSSLIKRNSALAKPAEALDALANGNFKYSCHHGVSFMRTSERYRL